MNESKLVVEGIIADVDKDLFLGQIVISKETGLIEEVIDLRSEGKAIKSDVIYDKDCVIFAGMGDIHIHAREDETGKQMYKEDYTTSSLAALNGGVVHVSAMPNTPSPLTTQEQLEWHRNRVDEIDLPVHITPYVGIGPNTKPLEEEVPYKVFTGPSVGDLFFRNREELEDALRHYENQNVSFHVEDFDVLEKSQNEPTHNLRRPVECVEVALSYVLELIKKYSINAKLCHWSIGRRSFEMIQKYRDEGCRITLEVSPLHLLFDSDMINDSPEMWPYVQMNPAIQSREHRLDLIKGLKDDFIDFLATDHAPHTLDEKFVQFEKFKENYPQGLPNEEIYRRMLIDDPSLCRKTCCLNATSGAPWLDTYSYVVVHLVKEHGFSYKDIARITSYNPGKFVNEFLSSENGKGYGKVEKDYLGCLTVINFNKKSIMTRAKVKSKAGWSALEGREFSGVLEAVIVKGEIVGRG